MSAQNGLSFADPSVPLWKADFTAVEQKVSSDDSLECPLWVSKDIRPPPAQPQTDSGRLQAGSGHSEPVLAHKGRSNPGQRPALLNDFASSPAALKAAIACFVVMATVVFVSVLLPPAAPTIAIDNAIS